MLLSFGAPRKSRQDTAHLLKPEYFEDQLASLYNEDFLWGMAIQMACLQSDRRVLYPKKDRVLDRLITTGVKDVPKRYEEGGSNRGRDVPTSLEMRHTSSIGNQLLHHIEIMEKEVGRLIQRDEALN